ncbi:aminotransferase class I/II-fold pyridoxal phosphate-dependent enzyme [Sporolactobacillus nakayamae]|uniref:Arginine/lysine/ornithine decarboxylase n=1 Tax=Sporolactobacillus nakayamae TaxID=269670 RepID=A0A1I2UIK9_9BACL|nr:aminotransferase class I/II-fold pyridoxal phosphate-dependent enzyme [Sporolactobacillus nakayamae]SFG76883.1 Arginine/lysine/ornithine decarboxylase [Sporolactobacillus nakayamae]
MDQKRTPVFDGLIEYSRKQAYSFHVPGHKDGHVFPGKAGLSFKSILALDATEVANLDDLYHPTGILRDAQQLLGAYYGTKSSYFLVGGSTIGNVIMILAACEPGDVVFVQRDSHKSVINALKLADVRPVFLAPSIDPGSGLPVGIEPQTFDESLRRFPQAKALILTYPNYYGIAARSVRYLITQAHERGLSVLVDEAHGPHFKIGAPVPPSTLDMGADIVVHSAHKMLPAMTMGAYLHVNSERISMERIERFRSMLQSSSPSYPIMASLDLARHYMATLDRVNVSKMIASRDAFVQRLQKMNRLTILQADPDQFMLDPFKVVLCPSTRENGFDVQDKLIRLGLYPEMADPNHVLLVLGLTETINYEGAIRSVAEVLSQCASRSFERQEQAPSFPEIETLADSYRKLSSMKSETVDQSQAIGRIAAEQVIPYPPGIPIVVEGEYVTRRELDLICYWQRAGAVFQNESANKRKIKVYQAGEHHKNDT